MTNPTNSQLAESELDLVVAGTRDAVMMVEAGAKILPEDVMADAIAYGHAELQKSIELQDKLVASAGTPKKVPFIGPEGLLRRQLGKLLAQGQQRVRRLRPRDDRDEAGERLHRRHRRPPRCATARSSTASSRWSTPDGRSSATRCTASSSDDVANAPTASEVLTNFTAWVGDTPVVAHNISFDLPFVLRHLPNDVKWEPTAVFDTLELGYQLYPDAGAWKLGDLVRFVFGRDHAAAHRAMPDAEATAELFIALHPGPLGATRGAARDIADEVRRARESYNRSEQGDRLEDIRRRHGIGSPLMDVITKSTVRELVLSENIRIDGRDTTTIRPISVEVGVLPRTHGSDLFQRGQTQALSIATLGPSSDVQRMDTISPGDREALHAPLQHAAVLGRRGEVHARPRPS